jgi:hypothetical protein
MRVLNSDPQQNHVVLNEVLQPAGMRIVASHAPIANRYSSAVLQLRGGFAFCTQLPVAAQQMRRFMKAAAKALAMSETLPFIILFQIPHARNRFTLMPGADVFNKSITGKIFTSHTRVTPHSA